MEEVKPTEPSPPKKKDEKDKDAKPADDELSEEDAALKSELEMLVERLKVLFLGISKRVPKRAL